MDTVVIKSVYTSATLTFSEKDGEYFNVVYEGAAVKLQKRVWGYTDCQDLVNFFQFIAKEYKGWNGVRKWASIEGEFVLSATCDSLGHVMFSLTICEFNEHETWESNVSLGIESGQTESIVKKMEKFFAI
jgi:hypothetical protein